jgi:hypothetical protein
VKRLFILAVVLVAPCACSHAPPAFREGDTAIARNFGRTQYNGTEVRITGGLAWREVYPTRDMVRPVGDVLRCYEVTTTDGEKFAAQEFQLKKIGNPTDVHGDAGSTGN